MWKKDSQQRSTIVFLSWMMSGQVFLMSYECHITREKKLIEK